MYVKTQWVDNTTPIDKDNLNKIEQGIYDNSLVVDAVTNTLNPTDTETYKTAELTEGQITDVIGISDIVIKGDTEQDGEPTPDSPVDVSVVSGSNVINTSNKNLMDKDREISQGATNNSADTTRVSIRVKHKLKANTTYTFSFNGTNCSSLRIVSVDEQTVYAQAPATNPYKVSYTPSIDTLVAFRLWGSGLTGTDFMLEVSNTGTSYEPYKVMTYPITFGSTITDGAEIDLLSGVVKINSSPVTYTSITPIAIRTYKGINNIYSDIGNTSLTYRETLKHYLEKQQ